MALFWDWDYPAFVDPLKFESQAEAKIACFSYIVGFYNPVRLHSAIGYQSPINYEQQTAQELAVTP